MSFLVPAFLAGLAAVGIPIWVHLAYRSKGTPTPFPSLHFLRRIPFRTRRRRVLRHPFLFALRTLVVVLVVLAFARPVLPGAVGTGPERGGREVVLLVDRSYSMGYRGRWEEGLRAARRAVEGLAPGDRASLVVFDERAEVLVPPTGTPERLRSALEGLRPGYGGTAYESGFRAATRLLAESGSARREVVLVTDFQSEGWADRGPLALPPGSRVRAVDLSRPGAPNLLLSDLSLVAGSRPGQAEIAVRVSNAGQEPVRDAEVSLEVNGRMAGVRAVELTGRSAATVRFASVPLPPGGARGTLRLAAPPSADGLAVDNRLVFRVAPEEALRVEVVEPGRGRADRSLYLRRALGIGTEPRFELRRMGTPEAALEATSGRGAPALVVLNDADVGAAGAASALARYVEAGGGLWIALGARSDPRRWPETVRRLLPGRPGAAVDRVEAGGVRLATVEYAHPVFEPFRAPRSGDLTAARFLRYREVVPDTAAEVLARFDDGAPALISRTVGRGRVLLWASSLDRSWNDLPIQPVFLPLVRRIAAYGASWEPDPRARTVGDALDVAALLAERPVGGGRNGVPAGGSGADQEPRPGTDGVGERASTMALGEWVAVTPAGRRVPIRTDRGEALVVLDEPGFWEVRRVDGQGPVFPVAVNLDPIESDLRSLDPEELLAAAGVGPGGLVATEAETGAAGSSAEAAAAVAGTARAGAAESGPDPGSEIWWALLLAAMLLLLAEGGWARRQTRGAGAPRAEEAGASERAGRERR